MSEKLAKLKADLKLAEENVEKDAIKKNKLIYDSLTAKIRRLKEDIRVEEGKPSTIATSPKEAVKTEKTTAVKKEATVKVAKVKAEKPVPKVKETKEGLSVNGFSAGTKVTFVDRATDKKKTGTIVKIEKCHGREDYNAFVEVSGVKQKVRLGKLTKA